MRGIFRSMVNRKMDKTVSSSNFCIYQNRTRYRTCVSERLFCLNFPNWSEVGQKITGNIGFLFFGLWNSAIWIQIKVKKAELPTWIYAMFSLCILLIVFTFKRRQNTKKHMVCHHEFQENEVAYRCLEGFSDITW